ncbi:MAG TPA: hypothetical protein VIH82_08310, partial [Acidimicrobiia bacterium]
MTRHHRAAAALLVLLLTLCAGPAAGVSAGAGRPPDESTNDARGRQLVDRFLVLIKEKDVAGLRRFLSPAFQVQRADGSYFDKAKYLHNPLPTLEKYE